MKNPAILMLVSIGFLWSCNDDSKNVPLIVGSWKVVDWYDTIPRDINDDGVESTDLFSQWNGCRKNSILVLSEDHTTQMIYKGKSNNPKCPPGRETNDLWEIEPWEFSINNNLIFRGDDYSLVSEVIELSSETLILSRALFMTGHDPDISYFTGGYLKFQRE